MREIGALLELVPRDINGIALMRAILKIAGVPVIFLSAYGQDETIARVVEMGTWICGQALLPDGAHGADGVGAAPEGGGRAVGALRAGRSGCECTRSMTQ